ncbi:hypothetical protein SO802_002496 [Lithocarpus litseifolius]|uniref:Uncharacterized protein n=1 Tax=Lithocarpus litseifolius TaxID=425828 RepID=A0AAW2DXD5_9ROSI
MTPRDFHRMTSLMCDGAIINLEDESSTRLITQPLEGVGLRVLYLAERVRCQLVGEDALQLREELDYDEFNCTRLMPSLTVEEASCASQHKCHGLSFSGWHTGATIQERGELVWLAGNLKLEVTQYLKDLYGPRGLAYPSNDFDDDDDDDDDDSDVDGDEDSEATPSHRPKKRRFW